jgi:hypothetical protein
MKIASVHEQQEQHDACEGEVGADHQRPSRHAVGDEAAERAQESAGRVDEEHEPGGGARSGQRLGPDPEHEEHRRVAEHRHGLTRHEQARVGAREQPLHGVACDAVVRICRLGRHVRRK